MKIFTIGLVALGLGVVLLAESFSRTDLRSNAELSLAASIEASIDTTLDQAAGIELSLPVTHVEIEHMRCVSACLQVVEALWASVRLTDDDYAVLFADVADVARYLSADANVRAKLIELARSSDDGNKRALIRAAFEQASSVHRRDLGIALLSATDALKRREGVNVLAAEAVVDSMVVTRLTQLLATEMDVYTKIAAVRGFDKPEIFRGDRAVLAALRSTLRTEISPRLRGEALVVSARLAHKPEDIFYAVSAAMVSADEDYRLHGLRALEAILTSPYRDQSPLSWQSRAQAKATLEELLGQDAVEVPPSVVREASFVYARHFH